MRKQKRIELSQEAIDYWNKEAKRNGNQKFKPFVEQQLEVEKFIVYFKPHMKQKNQFHIAAPTMKDALRIFQQEAGPSYKSIGCKGYPKIHEGNFKNLTFH